MKIKDFADRVTRALFPARCMVCGKVICGGDLCPGCETAAAFISGERCELCGCGKNYCECKKKKRYYEMVCAPFYYENGVRKAVHRFKFNGQRWLKAPMSRYMAKAAEENINISDMDIVTCVPFTKKQLRKRGYNQSCLLAEEVAKRLDLPFDKELLIKLYDTDSQHRMAKANRTGNVMGIFDAPHPEKLTGRTVLVCDDVKTTGATLDECAKMLILNGAYKVYGLCLAIPRAGAPGKERR